jgi:hypothetical protein
MLLIYRMYITAVFGEYSFPMSTFSLIFKYKTGTVGLVVKASILALASRRFEPHGECQLKDE